MHQAASADVEGYRADLEGRQTPTYTEAGEFSMYDRILKQIRELIRARRYVMTTHADEEMHDDGLSIHDIENALLSGEIFGISRLKGSKS